MKKELERLLARNVEDIIERKHLETALQSKRKLRIKHGIDPTGMKIHLGHAVVLWKLREFQELGHTIVLIVGDFTAQIGDPSDKLEKRPFLTRKQIAENLKDYLPQIGKIIDVKKAEVHYNSEWLGKLNFQEISQLAENFTVQQMIERKNFKERWERHREISLREFLYPLMQGYDSVAVRADVEIGGTDQLFNMMAGRKIQERYGKEPQDVVTCKMLRGTDGRKMSKSWGNVINTTDSPREQYGKTMALRDELMEEYFILATDLPEQAVAERAQELRGGENPKAAKEQLAFAIVRRYHGKAAAKSAAEEFRKVFSEKKTPTELPALLIREKTIGLLELLLAAGVSSKSEARRLITQGGVEVDGAVHKDPALAMKLNGGEILKIGKRRFFKIS